ncbi:mhcA, partial [Symbiodinium sp. KB8]
MATFEPGSLVMVPHPELCFAAARVTDAFKPGEAGKVELLDGTVSGGTIVSTCAEGEQIFCSNAVVAIAAAPLAPLAGILLAGWAVIEGAAGELHHRRGKAHAAAPGPLPAVGGAPHAFSVSATGSKSASLADETALELYDNMIKQNNLNEALILHNLRERFLQDKIYTYISSILVAVNPFCLLPIYTPEVLERYKDGGWRNQPPHIYAIADNAYASMLSEDADQAVVISGESGAGKTETMKLVLQFIAEVSARAGKKQMGDSKSDESLEQQILKSNPVMEWTEIMFNPSGAIIGGSIINYLLEKSRIPFQAEQERNYHVFYELIAGGDLDPAFKAELSLKEPDTFHYMNQSGVTT